MHRAIHNYNHGAPIVAGIQNRNYRTMASFLRGDLKHKWWQYLYERKDKGMPNLPKAIGIPEWDKNFRNLLAEPNIIYLIRHHAGTHFI
jgi:hypothetical protein